MFKSTRLGFRDWKDDDLLPFTQMNKDKEVMEFFPYALSQDESLRFFNKIRSAMKIHGFSLYAVDRLDNRKFIGFIGFMYPSFKAYFTPCIEIGWRLMKTEWNNGFATEGALASISYGFNQLNFKEVYSLTSILNLRSERVMQKIGMQQIGEFDHPKLPIGHRLRRHVLYKIINANSYF
ncbi:MAG TPA: GNAT family N-acetyltransferase [Cyclobacteriaceae bacterium]